MKKIKRGSSKKSGQLDLSFGMIFAILLIIVFLLLAFFVIKKFLEMKSSVETGKFVDDLQTDVDKMWKSTQGSQPKTYSLPSKVEQVCFVNYGADSKGNNSEKYSKFKQVYNDVENLFFYPIGSGEGLDAKEVKHIDIAKITLKENPYCILKKESKMSITISKEFNEALVTIK